MATSTYPATGGFVDNTSAATFIPEIWSDEVIAAYEKNLVLANLVKKMSMTGKKGDTIHIPKPTRGSANAKVENTAVTVQNAVETEVTVVINKHFEYSRLIEDITEAQALASLRQFYTGDAGYALAKQVDDDLFSLAKSFGDGDGSAFATGNAFFIDASTGLTEYEVDTVTTSDVFTDAGFRALITVSTVLRYFAQRLASYWLSTAKPLKPLFGGAFSFLLFSFVGAVDAVISWRWWSRGRKHRRLRFPDCHLCTDCHY
jgi:hypothetical protein